MKTYAKLNATERVVEKLFGKPLVRGQWIRVIPPSSRPVTQILRELPNGNNQLPKTNSAERLFD